MSNSDIKQSGTVNGRISNGLNLSGRISIGSGSSDFIINMTVTTTDGETFTVTSCDATREQIDAAVAADKRVVLRVPVGDIRYELPMVYSYQGYVYLFTAFILGSLIYAVIEPVGENENEWSFVTTQIEADAITYSNSSLSNVSDVKGALNELVSDSHTHLNKTALDKFSETDGKPTYNGETIGGENTIYIPAKLNQLDETFTIETSVTFEQVDAAYKSGQEQILKVEANGSGENAHLIPLVLAIPGRIYYFEMVFSGYGMLASVSSSNEWDFVMYELTETSASNVSYNDTTVKGALDDLGSKSHTHNNKSVLDMLSVSNGKLQYNGSDVGLKGDTPVKGTDYWNAADKAEIVNELKPSQVTSGTSITLADNTEYRLTDVTELTITYPDGNFECWMRLTFAADGTITVTLPSTTQYIGATPTFANGETWEMSIKDGIVVAQKVGDGT